MARKNRKRNLPKKIPRHPGELEEQLKLQLDFLESSCSRWDEGQLGESIRIASTLRTLLHDTTYSKSLLGQLNLKSISFFSANVGEKGVNWLAFSPLCRIQASSAGNGAPMKVTLVPMATKSDMDRCWLPFSSWWDQIVLDDKRGTRISRKDIVLAVADQDGGAHVDSDLCEKYYNITRFNVLGIKADPTGFSIDVNLPGSTVKPEPQGFLSEMNPTHSILRHIGYEVSKSLVHSGGPLSAIFKVLEVRGSMKE